ncbi:hypothetical protein PV04_03778 [Phialophora macrospora]|uniref:Uncharacterized protein n=1 Tax=Phialophora macrospora TaxID=1851006 RepID=A0A0D2EBH3_9EURO|nr:hypothetical protein PV04_03778 [Phialophora macrospora]
MELRIDVRGTKWGRKAPPAQSAAQLDWVFEDFFHHPVKRNEECQEHRTQYYDGGTIVDFLEAAGGGECSIFIRVPRISLWFERGRSLLRSTSWREEPDHLCTSW